MAIELSDDVLSTVVPVVVYWVASGVYELLNYLLEHRRMHAKWEEEKNLATKSQVLKVVFLQQLVQVIIVFSILKVIGEENAVPPPQPPFMVIVWQFFVGMVVLDTWQYFGHRYMHVNKFLYKHIHSWHHALVAPYAFGSLYNNPLEGLFLDTVGGSLAFLVTGMTPRTSIYFFSFLTVKSMDVHCSLWMPWSPLQFLFVNNCAYHDVHHQLKGNKFNYAQPFFISWDKIFGTHIPHEVVKRPGGGYEVRILSNNSKED